jgi:hypothetical protein
VIGTSTKAISGRLRLSMVAKTKDDIDLKGEKDYLLLDNLYYDYK